MSTYTGSRGTHLLFLALGLGVAPAANAQPVPEDPARVVVATATSPAATFAARGPGEKEFTVLPEKADLTAGDLLVTLPGATLKSRSGAVAVTSLADYDGKSPLPTLETAFTLNEPKDVELDLTLDRGRVDLTNTKEQGAVVVQVRFWDQNWKITLDKPGTRVALELCGRWPQGARFRPTGTVGEASTGPVASLVLLVVDGTAAADVGGVTLGLKAPPGPALVEWDSVGGARPQPLRQDKLPAWSDPGAALSEDGRRAAAAVEKFRRARAENTPVAVARFLASADPAEQRVALVTLGATDDLGGLVKQLSEAKTPEVWDFGITIVRHWLGRCPGQDTKLYQALISPVHGYTRAHARIIMQLLFGFSADDLSRPETYEVLIEYLKHDMAAIRNLAVWHLVRLVPQGEGIAFKPTATKAECERAYAEWKKLVPTGELPPPAPKK